jgi:hypothetical protein
MNRDITFTIPELGPDDPTCWPKPGEHCLECQWCGCHLHSKRSDAKYHKRGCRQAAWRANNQIQTLTLNLDLATASMLYSIASLQGVSSQLLATEVLRQFVDSVLANDAAAD